MLNREYEYAKTFMRFYNGKTNNEKVNIHEILSMLETSFNKLHNSNKFHSVSNLVVCNGNDEMITYNNIYFEDLYMDYLEEAYDNDDYVELTVTYSLGNLTLFDIRFSYNTNDDTFAVSLDRMFMKDNEFTDEIIYLYNIGKRQYRTYTDLPLHGGLKPVEICEMFLDHVLQDDLQSVKSIKKAMKNLLKE